MSHYIDNYGIWFTEAEAYTKICPIIKNGDRFCLGPACLKWRWQRDYDIHPLHDDEEEFGLCTLGQK